MSRNTYHYNPETCQYERSRITSRSVLGFSTGLLFLSAVVFVGILFVQSRFFLSDREKALRTENSAIENNKKLLNNKLKESKSRFALLDKQDATIYASLFPTTSGDDLPEKSEDNLESLLLVNQKGFNAAIKATEEKLKSLTDKSLSHNYYFSDKLNLDGEQKILLASMPSIQPIVNDELTKLISGFGVRINPFHKGHYDHLGIDFAAPRGTSVIATAAGRVTNIVHSTLEAGYGNYIDINHGNGIITRYANIENIKVKQGQKVSKSEEIATVGTSGGSVAAPHVHYEISREGEKVDPIDYFIEGLTSTQRNVLVELAQKQNQSLD